MGTDDRKPERAPDGLAVVQPTSVGDWERWLDDHHAQPDGVWLRLGKKSCPHPSISYAEALDAALCFGWIDGQVRGGDEHFTLRRFTPRRARSKWSQINCAHVERLASAGRMRPPGEEQVRLAQEDGRWDAAYAPASTITTPPDLQQALDAHPEADAFFATLTGSDRYAFLYRLHHVIDPERRRARIENYIERLGRRQTL